MAGGFYGTFTPRLDDKGRLTLPARYRGAFVDGAMVVRGDMRCLYVFTQDGFDTFAEEAINAPVTDPQRIGPARYMLANSDFQSLDAQGRIMLTGRMRDYAGLGKDVVLTGQGKRMEIWNAERWAEYEADQEPTYINRNATRTGEDPVSSAPTAGAGAHR
ncbi:MAG: division/cell wall cluster transcriptional repressor MraZ [Actinobacteria bacterium]|nr:division/cell wall cluster transcriptional repressor MraZ [Actinomycetota bacterium]